MLGATGTIGELTLEVAARHPDRLRVLGLGAGGNGARLAELAARFAPEALALTHPGERGAEPLAGWRGALLTGPDAQRELARWPGAEIVVNAVVGAAGLAPSLAALESGRRLALANKESLVMAGALLRAASARHGGEILPIDSEHSALFQCLEGRAGGVRRVVLTASGGPLRGLPPEALERVTPAEALRHPTWRMGPRITVDSATMLNKGFELIEARWLFDLPLERIAVWVHPQAIVHGLVEFEDGALLAQLSRPDMRLPIQYAFTYPERRALPDARCDLARIGRLEFFPPDDDRFPALRLARRALEMGGTGGAVLNGANEVAVETFLAGLAPFPRIWEVTARVLDAHRPVPDPTLPDILEADRWARLRAREML